MTTIPGQSRWATQPNISDRELDVLRAASRGLNREMTAETYGITLETVKTHLAAVRFKLRAKTTAHAVAEAIRRGLIP